MVSFAARLRGCYHSAAAAPGRANGLSCRVSPIFGMGRSSVHCQDDQRELLQAASIPASLQPDPAWDCYNLVLAAAGSDAGGAFAEFRRADPARPGNLSQCLDIPAPSRGAHFVVTAEVRATGAGAAGINIYLYGEDGEGEARKVYQASHPGDGAWHTLTRAFSLPDAAVRRIRVMVVLRSGEAPLAVRGISLRRLPAAAEAPPDLDRLRVSPAFHAAVSDMVDRHPASADPGFRDRLYRSLIGANRKGMRVVGEVNRLLAPTGFSIRGGRFLDLGSGVGGSLAGAKEQGAAWCEGWEINAQKLALSRLNVDTLYGGDSGILIRERSVEEPARIGPGFRPFDLVISGEVLEHVKDIEAAMATLARCIEPARGVAHVTIPNGFALENVLADPHLDLFGITLLDRFEAQPAAAALKRHTHYSAMMGGYHRYGDYVRLFAAAGLAAVPRDPTESSRKAIRACMAALESIRRKRSTLRDDWGGRVDGDTIALLESRLDAYIAEADVRLDQALASAATPGERQRFVQEYATGHLAFIVAHEGSATLGFR